MLEEEKKKGERNETIAQGHLWKDEDGEEP